MSLLARGCVVQDEEFRDLQHGRRGEGVCSKGRKKRPHGPHELISTLSSGVPDIPDIAEAKGMIKGGTAGAFINFNNCAVPGSGSS